MYTLYKIHFLNGISEINQLFDDILIIWPAPVYALMSTVANKNRVNHLVIYDSTGALSQFSSNLFSSLMGQVGELGCQKYPTLHFIVNKRGCVYHIYYFYFLSWSF